MSGKRTYADRLDAAMTRNRMMTDLVFLWRSEGMAKSGIVLAYGTMSPIYRRCFDSRIDLYKTKRLSRTRAAELDRLLREIADQTAKGFDALSRQIQESLKALESGPAGALP